MPPTSSSTLPAGASAADRPRERRSRRSLSRTARSLLARLLDEFLLFARPQPLTLLSGDLSALVRSAIASLLPEASARVVDLVLEAEDPVVVASEVGGRVRVEVRGSPTEARLLVEDAGCGLPPGAPVFEPFFTTKANGTGLGLAIAHQAVCDHGGSIEVENRSGPTRFALSLPRH